VDFGVLRNFRKKAEFTILSFTHDIVIPAKAGIHTFFHVKKTGLDAVIQLITHFYPEVRLASYPRDKKYIEINAYPTLSSEKKRPK